MGVTIEMHPLDGVEGLTVYHRSEARFEDPGGVHAWFCNLDELESGPGAFSLLSPAERARAARLRADHDRRWFVMGRAFTRRVIGSLVRRPPESLVFRTGRCGKPYLHNGVGREGDGSRGLNFSVSHSEHVLGLAVAFDREIGLDVEVVRPLPDPLGLAATQLDPAALDLLRSSPAPGRDLLFYRLWTRREAFAKMQGRGIDCRHGHEPPAIARWTLRSFMFREYGKGVVGAFALEDHTPRGPR